MDEEQFGVNPGSAVESPTLPLPPPREGHSLGEALQALPNYASRSGPLAPELLRDLRPLAASDSPDEAFDSRSARTLWLAGAASEAGIRRSAIAEGAFEIDRPYLAWGLPGRSLETLGAADLEADSVDESCAGHAPRSVAIAPHLQLSVTRQPHVVRTADGRRFRQSEDPHVQIYGSDNRFEIYPIDYPAHCVCHLTVWTRRSSTAGWDYRGEGTGFLAGRRVCVTASHLWPDGDFAEWKIDIIPGDYVVGVSTMGVKAHTNAHSARRANADIGSDIMVLGLYDAVGDLAGYFGTKAYTDDWEDWNVWSMAGYPYDHPGVPTAQTGISIYDDDDGPTVSFPEGGSFGSLQLESYADEASGMSGAPLFSWFEDGLPYAVGVHTGREIMDYGLWTDRNSVASGGSLLNAMVRWARQTWD